VVVVVPVLLVGDKLAVHLLEWNKGWLIFACVDGAEAVVGITLLNDLEACGPISTVGQCVNG
jgi:hypothetical protein